MDAAGSNSSSSSSHSHASQRHAASAQSTPSTQAAIVDDEEEMKSTEPSDAPAPRRAYGQRRVSDEHKRERNRVTFRRFYQRKQDTLRELRQEEGQLTEQYEQLKLARPEFTEPSSHTLNPGASILELIAHKEQLAAEQAVLQQAAQQQLKTRHLLGRLVDAMQDETEQGPPVVLPTPEQHLLLPPPLHDPEALLDEAIHKLREIQCLSEMSHMNHDNDAVGWQCWSQVQHENKDGIAFRVTKHFPALALPLDEAARRTWHFYSDAKSSGDKTSMPSQKILIAPSSLVRIHRHVVSATSDTTRLVYRRLTRVHEGPYTTPTTGGSGKRPLHVTKSIYSVTHHALDAHGGFCIVSHAVPNQEAYDPVDRGIHTASSSSDDDGDLGMLVGAAPRDIQEEWIRELTWWRIEPSAAGGVQVSYSGLAHVCMALSPTACFMEFLRLAVQWEDAVLGATPLLCLDQ